MKHLQINENVFSAEDHLSCNSRAPKSNEGVMAVRLKLMEKKMLIHGLKHTHGHATMASIPSSCYIMKNNEH